MIISPALKYLDIDRWHHKLGTRSHQVCRVELGDSQPIGTGFLIGPDIVITAYHVIDHYMRHSKEPTGKDVALRFDYKARSDGTVNPGTRYGLDVPQWLVDHSPFSNPGAPSADALDYAILKVAGAPGLDRINSSGATSRVRGWVELLDADYRFAAGEAVVILQHPQGGPLQLAFNSQAVIDAQVRNARVTYAVSTSPGSSGAPCLNVDLDLVALHEGSSKDLKSNQGITMFSIFLALQAKGLRELVTVRPPDLVSNEESDATPSPSFAPDPSLLAAIANGESETVEFKQALYKNPFNNKPDEKIREKVIRGVAGLMNARGGVLLIGISDDGKIIGINDEYGLANPKKSNWDGFGLALGDILNNALSIPSAFDYFSVRRYVVEGADLCSVTVRPTPRAVYVDDRLFVRAGAQTKELRGPHLVEYVSRRWEPNIPISVSEKERQAKFENMAFDVDEERTR
jgi:Trypsin-like peptidase domain/Putative DNA-binding domain